MSAEPEVIAQIRIRVRWLESENVLIASQARELREKCAILDAYDALKAERDAAVRDRDNWKAATEEACEDLTKLRFERDRWESLYEKIRHWGEQWCEMAAMHRKIVERVTMLTVEYQDKINTIERNLSAIAQTVNTEESALTGGRDDGE